MIFKEIKNTTDYKVMTNDRKLIGYITERKEGFLFKPKSDEFIGMTYDKTLTQAQRRAEVFYEIYAPYL